MRFLSRRRLRRFGRRALGGAVPASFAALILCSVMGVSNRGFTPESGIAPLPTTTPVRESVAQPSSKITDPRMKKLARMAAEASGGRYTSNEIIEKANQLQALGVRLEDLERYVPERFRSSLKFRDLKERAKSYARKALSSGAGPEKAVTVEPPLGIIEIGVLVGVVAALLFASTRTRVRS